MSEADMQMVREHVPGGYNLAVGEPFFLQEIYGHLYPRFADHKPQYPQLGGDPALVKLLETRYGGQKVVVANGAKQALLAACYAIRKADPDKIILTHQTPYWPTYPTIAELTLVNFEAKLNRDHGSRHTVRVLTSPNNPDGHMGGSESTQQWDIWDAAYASRVYGWDGIVPWHRISVWSGAKLYGPSGYRVGWLVTADHELARLAAEYVEKTTSGVASPSQSLMKIFLQGLPADTSQLDQLARDDLLAAGRVFRKLDHLFLGLTGLPVIGQGMFAWVKARNPDQLRSLLAKAKVKFVGGQFCGADDSWFRFSMGVGAEVMHQAVDAILEAERGSS